MTQPRPLSPHLRIYKPQLTSVSSIAHRVSGMVLCLGYGHLCLWISLVVLSPELLERSLATAPIGFLWYLALWLEGTALLYHTLNGIRHLAWDAGYGLTIHQVERTAILLLVTTALGSSVLGLCMLL